MRTSRLPSPSPSSAEQRQHRPDFLEWSAAVADGCRNGRRLDDGCGAEHAFMPDDDQIMEMSDAWRRVAGISLRPSFLRSHDVRCYVYE